MRRLTWRRLRRACGCWRRPSCLDLLVAEAGLEELIGEQRQTVLDRRVEDLTQVGGEHVVLDAGGAHAVEDVLPGDLAGVGRREAALEQGAALGEVGLLLERQVLRRELGVGDDDVPHARGERGVDDREDLVAGEVAGGEHQLVAGRDLEDAAHGRQQLAVGVDHRHRLRLDRRLRAAETSNFIHTGIGAPGANAVDLLDLVDELTVGIQTVRAPSRAAISTASALMPPTARLSTIAPIAWMPGTAALTVRARSAVEV